MCLQFICERKKTFGIGVEMNQYITLDLIRLFSYFASDQGMKEFLLKLPVGFWTLASGLVTAGVAILTLVVTQMMNLKTQEKQAKTQNEILTTQLNHQRELAYRQHFLDKRTDALLDFQKELEECMEILDYFYSESADLERRKELKVTYGRGISYPLRKEDINEVTRYSFIIDMASHALKQLSDIEERTVALKKASRLFEIYLQANEKIEVAGIVKRIDYLQNYLIKHLKQLNHEPGDSEVNCLMFVHMIDDEDASFEMKKITTRIHSVRDIFKKYLYIHKLDA